MHTHELQECAIDVGKEEPHADNDRQRQNAQLQVFKIDEVGLENLPAKVGEVEDFSSPIDADHYGSYAQHGQYHVIGQMIGPCLSDRSSAEFMTHAIQLNILRYAGDGEDTGQLHNPPNQNLYSQQRVAQPGTYHRNDEHQ